MFRVPGAKRLARKSKVRDYLIKHGPADLARIARATGLTPTAVSHALVDIRNDPTLEYATVATKDSAYTYAVAYTVDAMKSGLRNQAKHLLTRADSLTVAGEKAAKIAATPDEFMFAADLKANGAMLKAQAEAILRALK